MRQVTIAPGLVDEVVGRGVRKREIRTHLDHRQTEMFAVGNIARKIYLLGIFSVVYWLQVIRIEIWVIENCL